MAEKFVALYRVSTDKQGNSGLGLESQQHVVRKHVESVSGEIVHEFTEVISGRKTIRPQLEAAIALCQAYNATLICPLSYKLGHKVGLSYGGSGSCVGLIMQPAFDVASGVVGLSVS